MRCVIYGLVLIISYCLIKYTEAENKNYKKSKDIESDSEERYTKQKENKIYKSYKYKNGSIEGKEYEINKYDNRKCKGTGCDENKMKAKNGYFELTRENVKSKSTKNNYKYVDDSEERPIYKKKAEKADPKRDGIERNSEFKKNRKRDLIDEGTEDSDEDFIIVKSQKNKKNNNERFNKKELLKFVNQKDEDNNLKELKKEINRKLNHKHKKEVDENEADTEENTFGPKLKKNVAKRNKKPFEESEENYVEVNKNKISVKNKIVRKQSTSSENDSSEETNENDDESEQNHIDRQSDESNTIKEGLETTCKSKSKRKKCGEKECAIDEQTDGSYEANNAPIKNKKIKYSIKFAHEKQKINRPSENDHIMKKIHKEKKKIKYGDDDDEDFSEEHVHPKRFQYVDEDNEE